MSEKSSKSVDRSELPGALRTRAETLLQSVPTDLAALPREDIRALIHELQVHQMELEIQNEELRHAQVELAESHDRFSDLYEFAPVGYMTLDADGRIKEANFAAANLFGVSRKALLKTVIEDWVDRDSQDVIYLHKRRIFSAEEKSSCELEMRRRDGTLFTVRLESLAHGTAPDRQCRTALVDVTDWRRTEGALEAANQLLLLEHEFTERLIETAPSLILVLDPNGRIIRFNPAFGKLCGRGLREPVDSDWFDTFLPSRDRKRLRKQFKNALLGQRIQGAIGAIFTAEGEERLIEWFDAPLTGAKGELIGFLWMGSDITDRFQLEKKLYQASEDEKKRIAADLHDSLGSRLTGIGYCVSGISRKIRKGMPVDPEETDAILAQVREVMVHARALSRGLQPVRDEPEALVTSLKELATWVESSSELKCRFASVNGKVAISDPILANHLYRIAQEAATNAMRHSGASDLKIRLGTNKEGIFLSLSDNGSGFQPEKSALEVGFGLKTMDLRARAVQAKLTIRTRKSGGTLVVCQLAGE